jgi:2-polyprenyl-6-hydroxyphenyl methylase/3-demethylubiquinone-9 3-methyltransferase
MIRQSGTGTAAAADEVRFAFGTNWASYAHGVDDGNVEQAESGLRALLGPDGLAGKRFLDIGSGSGLHALAAIRLGATEVCAFDIDAHSVATTEAMLRQRAPARVFKVLHRDILTVEPDEFAGFDVVYSWGVLHHTGAMCEAVRRAAALVGPGGLFAFALYRKTWLCGLWRVEKRWYAQASARQQRAAQAVYRVLVRLGCLATGRRYREHVRNYRSNRGMDFDHDVHDWLGGYPYESIAPAEVDRMLAALGFEPVARNIRTDPKSLSGLLGSGCDEYVFRRLQDRSSIRRG